MAKCETTSFIDSINDGHKNKSPTKSKQLTVAPIYSHIYVYFWRDRDNGMNEWINERTTKETTKKMKWTGKNGDEW